MQLAFFSQLPLVFQALQLLVIEATNLYTRKMEVVEARRMNQNHKKM